jgi:hypothetical protein
MGLDGCINPHLTRTFMAALLHSGHKDVLDFGYSEGRFVP